VVDDAMDIHAGKAIMDGPSNYLGNFHRATPVAITVEGANLLTRSLIIFGQGAIRCHPYLLEEMLALADNDFDKGLDRFERAFWHHVGHFIANIGRSWLRNWSGGFIGPAPDAGAVTRHYKQLSRYVASFALVADFALLTLGGQLKRKEMLSARLGDILSELYVLSALLKRFHDEGQQDSDQVLVDYCMEAGLLRIENRLGEVLANLPNRFAAWTAKLIIQPFGRSRFGPSDGVQQGVLTESEAERLRAAETAVTAVIAVDDFEPWELSRLPEKDDVLHREHQMSSDAAAQ
jgi:acyl-CoA dehydrogenase